MDADDSDDHDNVTAFFPMRICEVILLSVVRIIHCKERLRL